MCKDCRYTFPHLAYLLRFLMFFLTFLFCFVEIGFLYVAQDGLEVVTFLPSD